jgi:endogenous inhibitor of DNA gyrase (YacG/DUF329 family)
MAGAVVCVTCRVQPVHPAWRPFCSERCKMTDLARWLNGEYRVPAGPADASADAEAPIDEEAALE